MSRSDFSSSPRETLRVAAFAGFAPFAWRQGTEARGRDIAFLRRFAATQNLAISVEFFEFDGLWELPSEGRADVAASGLSLMPEKRQAHVAWSVPYAEVRRSLLIRASDRARYRTMADFAYSRLAVVACSAAHHHAKETKPATATLATCPTLEEGIRDLLVGRVDAVGTGDVSARHHLAWQPGLAMIDVHEAAAPEYVSFAVQPSLQPALDAFITAQATPGW